MKPEVLRQLDDCWLNWSKRMSLCLGMDDSVQCISEHPTGDVGVVVKVARVLYGEVIRRKGFEGSGWISID